MGLIHTQLTLANPLNKGTQPLSVDSLVYSGALHLCIPEHIAIQLKLNELEKRELTVANGHKQLCPYVGPIKVQFENRSCFTGALVLGDAVLLGAIPMEDMDLVIHPSRLKITVNPESPNIPTSTVK